MKKQTVSLKLSGAELLRSGRFNKGTAFSQNERQIFSLHGLLPPRVETIEEQKLRIWQQCSDKKTALEKSLFLNQLAGINATLFYAFVEEHLNEMLPIIYTPVIGDVVKQFSRNFDKQHGLIISYPDIAHIDAILGQFSPDDFDIIVVTDGEGILGIGDQGVGGLNIAVGKLMVYTLCGGVNPFRTLPVMLDAGTNNQAMLDDPLYLGWRHPRISGQEYSDFINCFTKAFKKNFPKTLLHWEDFGRDNARAVLDQYRLFHPSFNDDIQGTGAVTLAAVLSGIEKTGVAGKDQKFCIFGAGSAGTGIADQICRAIAAREGGSEEEIRRNFFLIGRNGLLQSNQANLPYFQKPYAKNPDELKSWQVSDPNRISLLETVINARSTVLIGCSTAAGAFTDAVITGMLKNIARPIIMPLSNPTEKAEATPQQILAASKGQALIATGSPFGKVVYEGRAIEIAQCNNALIFPGLGLAMIISQAQVLSDGMLLAAAECLAEFSRDSNASDTLLPGFKDIRKISWEVALAVARQAIKEKLAPACNDGILEQRLEKAVWKPVYNEYISGNT